MVAWIWQLKQNGYITTDKIVKDGYTLCWAAKWVGEKGVMFDSIHKSTPKQMLRKMHKLLDEADAVLTYNGLSFDLPILNKGFIEAGMPPPSPYKHIDLIKTARSQFRFSSNKLDWISKRLGIGSKVKHKGMELWAKCMANDPQAWRTMEKYNRGDVILLERLYRKMLPWVKGHPNVALYGEVMDGCPKCGGVNLQRRGYFYTTTSKVPRFQCTKCGAWAKGPRIDIGRPMLRGV